MYQLSTDNKNYGLQNQNMTIPNIWQSIVLIMHSSGFYIQMPLFGSITLSIDKKLKYFEGITIILITHWRFDNVSKELF